MDSNVSPVEEYWLGRQDAIEEVRRMLLERGAAMTDRPPMEALDVAVGWAVHDLTTNIVHKGETPGVLDEDCAVLGQAIVGRIAALGLIRDPEVALGNFV